uniref:Uncharacterized protein n=1 Tax=Steinernema glaseri TaxID=37863 RepID=A0A1I7ZVG4_9BILA
MDYSGYFSSQQSAANDANPFGINANIPFGSPGSAGGYSHHQQHLYGQYSNPYSQLAAGTRHFEDILR